MWNTSISNHGNFIIDKDLDELPDTLFDGVTFVVFQVCI